MRTTNESEVWAMPVDLPSRLDRGAGAELEQFIQARWLLTAALLRQALKSRVTTLPLQVPTEGHAAATATHAANRRSAKLSTTGPQAE